MTIDSALQKLGLTSAESKVYVAVLKLGSAKASDIAVKANVLRGAAYYALTLLQEKGLVSEIIKSGVKYYSAADPAKIGDLLEDDYAKKKQILAEYKAEFEDMSQSSMSYPVVEVFEGYDGFKTLFLRLLAYKNCEFRCYLSPQILEYLPHFHEQFRKLRASQKIRIRTITQRTKKLLSIQKLDDKELRQTRFVDSLHVGDGILQYVVPDGVIVIRANSKEQIGYIIPDKVLCDLQKKLFDELWKKARL